MNLLDRWMSQCSCGVDTMFSHQLDDKEQEYLLKRKGYVALLSQSYYHEGLRLKEPFKHIDYDPDDKFYDGLVHTLDPLISGLIFKLLELKIDTIASCQGKSSSSPYIYTYATTEQLGALSTLFHNEKSWGNHWNNVLISFENIRNNKQSFLIQFYDIIAVLYHYKIITGLNPFEIPENIFIYNPKNN